MKKRLVLVILSVFVGILGLQAQKEESSTRKFISKSEKTQINKDWNTVAKFKSGIGESVTFTPVEVIDLNTNEKVKSLQIDMKLKSSSIVTIDNLIRSADIKVTGWVGIDEIQEMINFIEEYIIPNLKTKLKKQSKEFILKTKEMKMTFYVKESMTKIFMIELNSYERKNDLRYTFWTKTQVDQIPKLLDVLKLLIEE
jgi:hypothetical protein